jgi:hypothetical protein
MEHMALLFAHTQKDSIVIMKTNKSNFNSSRYNGLKEGSVKMRLPSYDFDLNALNAESMLRAEFDFEIIRGGIPLR